MTEIHMPVARRYIRTKEHFPPFGYALPLFSTFLYENDLYIQSLLTIMIVRTVQLN